MMRMRVGDKVGHFGNTKTMSIALDKKLFLSKNKPL
jgi:hypothetical protein